MTSQITSVLEPHFLLMGAPGAGKGTLTKYLLKSGQFVHLCVGDLLRDEIEKKTAIGSLFKNYVEAGELVPKEELFSFFEHKFTEALKEKKRLIIDGIVQSQENVTFFLLLLKKTQLETSFKFIYISITPATAKMRLLGRIVCNTCHIPSQTAANALCTRCFQPLVKRIDDKDTIIAKRIERFFTSTIHLIEQFKCLPSYHEINGEQTLASLYKDYQTLNGF